MDGEAQTRTADSVAASIAGKLPDVPETDDVARVTEKASENLSSELPDVPTEEPKGPDEPVAKKFKTSHNDSEEISEGWETVEKPTVKSLQPTVEDEPEEKTT